MKEKEVLREVGDAVLRLTVGDITHQKVDAIVNAANARLAGGGGVDGAIHRAGGPTIMEECRAIGGCPVGQAVVTGGGELNARYVIHTVGPMWSGGESNDAELLSSAYQQSLRQAVEHMARTVAFPSISTGAYGYPIKEASRIAIGKVAEFLRTSSALDEVRFVLFSESDYEVYAAAADQIFED